MQGKGRRKRETNLKTEKNRGKMECCAWKEIGNGKPVPRSAFSASVNTQAQTNGTCTIHIFTNTRHLGRPLSEGYTDIKLLGIRLIEQQLPGAARCGPSIFLPISNFIFPSCPFSEGYRFNSLCCFSFLPSGFSPSTKSLKQLSFCMTPL